MEHSFYKEVFCSNKIWINEHCVFLFGASHGTVGSFLWGIWTSQWRRLFMWQLFRMDRDNEDSFSSCGPSRKSGGHKALPRNFEYFLLWLDVILSVHVEWMCSHVLEIKIQTWARPQLSAFQRQPGSRARQIRRQVISAQCGEHSDGVDTDTSLLCVTRDLKDVHLHLVSCVVKQRNTET